MADKLRKSRQKLTNILSFLDEVEVDIEKEEVVPSDYTYGTGEARNGRPSVTASRTSSRANHDDNSDNNYASDSEEELALVKGANVLESVKSRVVSLKVELEDKNKTLDMLRKALENAKRTQKEMEMSHKRELSEKLLAQKTEYESAASRQFEFIDSLIKDKEDLTTQCETLSESMVSLKEKLVKKLESERESMKAAMRRERDQIITAEKAKREKFLAAKTKSIKEMTIKGLEPEIQTLISKNKTDREKAEEKLKAALLEQKEELTLAFQDQIHKIREELLKEKADAVEEERLLASQRLREYIERYDKQMQSQQENFQKDIAAERSRLLEENRKQIEAMRQTVQSAVTSESSRLKSMRDQHAEEMEELRRRMEITASQERERQEIEKSQWKEQILAKLNKQLAAKESRMSEKLKQERDEQLNKIVERLTIEHARELDELTKNSERENASTLESKNAVIEEQQEEIRSLRKQVKQLQNKVSDLEAELSTLRDRRDSLEGKVADIESYAAEREEAALAPVQKELQAAQAALERVRSDLTSTENELERTKSDHRRMMETTLEDYENRKAAELDSLTTRVKKAIEKKDVIISQLKDKLQSREEKIRHMNKLLEQQRSELVDAIS